MVISTLITLVTMGNALRLRTIRLSWNSGRLFGYPLFSSLFVLFVMFYFSFSFYFGESVSYAKFISYHWIGISWYITSYLMSKRYITDHGIVKNVNDTSQTISWNSIVDYVGSTADTSQKTENYHFMYMKRTSKSEKVQYHRLDIDVPLEKSKEFNKMIEQKLGRRFASESPLILNLGLRKI